MRGKSKSTTASFGSSDEISNRVALTFGENKVVSARELWQSNLIYWISSYKALLKYVSTDYAHIFTPVINGSASGKRYYIPTEHIATFLYKFENNEL